LGITLGVNFKNKENPESFTEITLRGDIRAVFILLCLPSKKYRNMRCAGHLKSMLETRRDSMNRETILPAKWVCLLCVLVFADGFPATRGHGVVSFKASECQMSDNRGGHNLWQ